MTTQMGTKLESGGEQKGQLKIADIVIHWKAELPEGEYLYHGSGMIISLSNATDGTINSNDENVPYSLEIKIEIE